MLFATFGVALILSLRSAVLRRGRFDALFPSHSRKLSGISEAFFLFFQGFQVFQRVAVIIIIVISYMIISPSRGVSTRAMHSNIRAGQMEAIVFASSRPNFLHILCRWPRRCRAAALEKSKQRDTRRVWLIMLERDRGGGGGAPKLRFSSARFVAHPAARYEHGAPRKQRERN